MFVRKILGILFPLLLIGACIAAWFIFPEFCQKQYERAQGMYDIYLGDKELKKAKLQRAIDYYQEGLRLYPEHERGGYNLGNIYVVYEDYFSALDAYEHAIKIDPAFIAARMNHGIVSVEKLGEFDNAIKQYQAILDVKPKLYNIPYIYNNKKSTKMNKGLAHYNTGVAYKQKYLYTGASNRQYLNDALKAYEKATEALKKDYDSRYNYALTHHLLGNYHDAGMNYCKAISLAPMNYEAHYNLAILLKHLKYYRESLDEMQKATTLITGNEGATNRQRYVFDVLNEVTRYILAEDESNQMFAAKLATPDEPAGTKGITYVNGKLVATEALDKAMMQNFSTCNAVKIFTEEVGEDYVERGKVKIRGK
jgi:tetratricopeptide (TPR) repeat protein